MKSVLDMVKMAPHLILTVRDDFFFSDILKYISKWVFVDEKCVLLFLFNKTWDGSNWLEITAG